MSCMSCMNSVSFLELQEESSLTTNMCIQMEFCQHALTFSIDVFVAISQIVYLAHFLFPQGV